MVFSSREGGGSSQRVSTMLMCELGYKQLDEADEILRPWCFLGEGPSYTTIKLGMLYREIDQMTEAELEEINLATKTLLNELGVPYDDLEPGYIDPVKILSIESRAQLWRSKACVDEFKAEMKKIAFAKLDANMRELDVLQRRYQAYFHTHPEKRESNPMYHDLGEAIKQDWNLRQAEYILITRIAQEEEFWEDRHSSFVPAQDQDLPLILRDGSKIDIPVYIQQFKDALSEVKACRKYIRDKYPVIDFFRASSDDMGKAGTALIYAKIEEGVRGAKSKIEEVKKRIDSGDMPMHRLGPVVDEALAFFGINAEMIGRVRSGTVLKKVGSVSEKVLEKNEFCIAVLQWLESEFKKDHGMKLANMVVTGIGTLATIAALFVPGANVVAALILAGGALVTSAASLPFAIYECESLDDLNQVALSMKGGTHVLLDDPEEIEKEYFWSWVNLILSIVDTLTSGVQFMKIKHLLNYFDSMKSCNMFLTRAGGVEEGLQAIGKIDKLVDGRAVIKSVMDATESDAKIILQFFATLGTVDNVAAVISKLDKFDNLDGLLLILKKTDKPIDFIEKISDDAIRFLTKTDKTESNIVLIDKLFTMDNVDDMAFEADLLGKIDLFENTYQIKFHERGDEIKQYSNSLDVLYKSAREADVELRKMTIDIAKKTGGHEKFPDGLKKWKRTIEKIDNDYKGDASKILDLSRSTIEFEELEDIYKAVAQISDEYEILRIKDRFKTPQPSGYRDIMMNVKMSNGHVVEIQLHLNSILEAKKLETDLYTEIRTIQGIIEKECRKPNLDEERTLMELIRQSREIYKKALQIKIGK